MMKVFAVGSITKIPTPEQLARIMPKEVPDTLQLYLDGAIDQFWHRKDKQGVIFLVNATTVDEARATLARASLGRRRLDDLRLHSCGSARAARSIDQGQVSAARPFPATGFHSRDGGSFRPTVITGGAGCEGWRSLESLDQGKR